MSESEPASPRAEPVWRLLCVADEDGVRVLARKGRLLLLTTVEEATTVAVNTWTPAKT